MEYLYNSEVVLDPARLKNFRLIIDTTAYASLAVNSCKA